MGGIAVWITGLPGSGKSTVADELRERHPDFVVLRMDEMRTIVTPEPAYTDTERELIYRSLVFLAKKLTELGHNVIIDATGNLRKWRSLARDLMPGYVEAYLKCSVEECRTREEQRQDARGAPRDIYRKGEKGWPVPGVNVPYEEAVNPEIIINSDTASITEAADAIDHYLRSICDSPQLEG